MVSSVFAPLCPCLSSPIQPSPPTHPPTPTSPFLEHRIRDTREEPICRKYSPGPSASFYDCISLIWIKQASNDRHTHHHPPPPPRLSFPHNKESQSTHALRVPGNFAGLPSYLSLPSRIPFADLYGYSHLPPSLPGTTSYSWT